MRTELRNIVVDFGSVRAVDHVTLMIPPAQILGLLGENGAGKTTLMNALAGALTPAEGEIYLDGERTVMHNTRHATKLGIRFIHQELSIVGDLNVFENMFLAEELTRGPFLEKKEMAERAARVFERMGVEIDPWMKAGLLRAGQKQLVEIARALLTDCKLIIMDEPTTALSTGEIERLFELMRALREQEVSFVYISHKMPEIFSICTSYAVLRDGKLVGSGPIDEIDEEKATAMMTGRQLLEEEDAAGRQIGEVAFSVKHLHGDGFEDISFDLRAGEILAVTGLQSSGIGALADTLYGFSKGSGEINVKGTPLYGGIAQRLKRGVAMVPRARKERGILTDLSIRDNLSMGYWNAKLRGQLIRPKDEEERYRRAKAALNIKAERPGNVITSLSGGNQQKVILARWLEADADVLLLDNPTQGIDVGSKFEIYALIKSLASSGKAIIVFSAEYAEIKKVADRCVVLYKGRVNAELSGDRLTEQSVMYYSTGANLEGYGHG